MAYKSNRRREDADVDEGFEDLSSTALHDIHYGHLNQGFEEETSRDDDDFNPVSQNKSNKNVILAKHNFLTSLPFPTLRVYSRLLVALFSFPFLSLPSLSPSTVCFLLEKPKQILNLTRRCLFSNCARSVENQQKHLSTRRAINRKMSKSCTCGC